MRALIVGGGIGGLSAAIALRQAGWEVRVFESAPELREAGAAITLWSNALKVARHLGVDGAIRKAGGEVVSGQIRTWRGELLFETPVGEVSRELDAPSICLPRASLQRILAAALPSSLVRLGASCAGFSPEKDGVVARFRDGREERGDLLVGADGIHSSIREQLFGPEEPRYSGHQCSRGLTTFLHPSLTAGHAFEAWGPGASFGMLPMEGSGIYWFANRVSPRGARDGSRKHSLRRRYASWPSPVPELIEATAEEAILQNDVIDRPPRRTWGIGRVTLLGDAIHPMTPNLGQGGCLAMEDAAVLARCLRTGAELVPALRLYEKQRRARCAWIVRESWRLARMSLMENQVLTALRNVCIRMAPSWWLTGRYRALVRHEVA